MKWQLFTSTEILPFIEIYFYLLSYFDKVIRISAGEGGRTQLAEMGAIKQKIQAGVLHLAPFVQLPWRQNHVCNTGIFITSENAGKIGRNSRLGTLLQV